MSAPHEPIDPRWTPLLSSGCWHVTTLVNATPPSVRLLPTLTCTELFGLVYTFTAGRTVAM